MFDEPVVLAGLDHGVAKGLVEALTGELVSRNFGPVSTVVGRFDGREFVTYNTRNGLSAKTVTDIVENPDGTYYVSLWDNQITLFDPSKTDRSKLFHSITV